MNEKIKMYTYYNRYAMFEKVGHHSTLKGAIVDVAHHDGNNQYILYFTEHTEISDISEIPIMDIDKQNKYIENYAIGLYDLWYKGDI